MKKIAITLFSLVLCGGVIFLLLASRHHDSIKTTSVNRPLSLSALAPSLLHLNGGAYAIVTGELDGKAEIVIVGCDGRDEVQFLVGPGEFEIAQGGAESWIGDYHIRYKAISAKSGSLYASVYCGRAMTEADHELHSKISRRSQTRRTTRSR